MDSGKPDFSLLDHTADMGILVRGINIKSLFEEAAKSMMYIMITYPPDLKKTHAVKVSIRGNDLPDLMVRWLGEILYLFHGEKAVVTRITISSISRTMLEASLKTVPFDSNLYDIRYELKAVTYHQAQVTRKDKYWEARFIFDL